MAALHPPLTLALAVPAYLALALATRAASAAPHCPIRTQPAALQPAWVEAADRARSGLAAKGGDCKDVLLEVEGSGARLTFTTLDGREATRWLEDPSSLEPALAALQVTLSIQEQETHDPRSAPASPPVDTPRRAKDRGEQSPPTHLLVHGQVGARLAGSDLMLAPALGAGVALTASDFELGVGAQWEPAYQSLGDVESPSTRLSSLGANIAAGRRNPIGGGRAIVTGVRVSAAVLHQEWWLPGTSEAKTEHEGERAQVRLGAYAGPIIPMSRAIRLRTLLEADIDPMHVGATRHGENSAPPLPWWGVSLSLGVESEL